MGAFGCLIGYMNELTEHGLRSYMEQVLSHKLLTKEEEKNLPPLIKKGCIKSKTRMVEGNLRLVVTIANDYAGAGLPLEDLISEGNIGLTKAVVRFCPTKGKFSVYAGYWIRQAIKRSLYNKSRTIRLPVHLVDKISKVKQVSKRLEEQLGREATEDEIADEIGIPTAKVNSLLNQKNTISLDSKVTYYNNEDTGTLMDKYCDEEAPSPFDILAQQDIQNTLYATLSTLNPREQAIIAARYGLDGNKPLTLEQLGVKFKVTRERIRQLQEIALEKMKQGILSKEKVNKNPHCSV